jgi:hypothetical protein
METRDVRFLCGLNEVTMMNFNERLRRLEENLNGRGASGDKFGPAPGSEPPPWLDTDSVCECEFHPLTCRRDDGAWICGQCNGVLLPGAIASIEKNFTAGEPGRIGG